MTDLLIREGADIALAGGDLVLDTGLGSAVVRSLLTDRRATPTELAADGGGDARGWWGDDAGDAWGSGLWLLARGKATQETLTRARELARESLRWLVDDGIAQAVDVDASYPSQGRLALSVRVIRGTATRWASLWTRSEPAYLATERLTLAILLEGATR